MDLNVDRYYNSREPVTAHLGWGWTYGLGEDVYFRQLGGDGVLKGPSGYTKVFRRNSDGSYKSPDGIGADMVKNADNTFTLSYHKSGEKWRFNTSGLLVERSDRNGRKLTFQYDANGMTQITDAQGRVVTLGRNSVGRTATLTDSSGRSRSYAYNTTGTGEGSPGNLLTSSTDQAGKTTSYGYTDSLLTSITDPLGRTTSFTYDGNRRITSVTRAGQTTTYAYAQTGTACPDDFNTVVTDPRGKKTTYCWEVPGRVTKVIDANGQQRSTSYTGDSNVKTSTNGTGGPVTTFNYDANDNLTSGSRPAGETFSLTYGDATNKYSPTSATNAQGTRTLFGYDANGNTTDVRDGASPTQNKATLEYNGQSGGTCPSSGPSGTLRCAIDGKGSQTRYGYDSAGNLTTITPPAPLGQTVITYDAISRIKTIRDGKGQTRTYTFDAMDRVTKIAYSDGSSVSTSYDADGNTTQRVDSSAGTFAYSYDAANRRTKDTPAGRRDQRLCLRRGGQPRQAHRSDGLGQLRLRRRQPAGFADRAGLGADDVWLRRARQPHVDDLSQRGRRDAHVRQLGQDQDDQGGQERRQPADRLHVYVQGRVEPRDRAPARPSRTRTPARRPTPTTATIG